MRMAVLLITLVGAMDLRAYPYSQSDRMRIEEADRRGGDEGRRVRAKIQQEHLDTWVFLNKMRKKNAVFYVTENGTGRICVIHPKWQEHCHAACE